MSAGLSVPKRPSLMTPRGLRGSALPGWRLLAGRTVLCRDRQKFGRDDTLAELHEALFSLSLPSRRKRHADARKSRSLLPAWIRGFVAARARPQHSQKLHGPKRWPHVALAQAQGGIRDVA